MIRQDLKTELAEAHSERQRETRVSRTSRPERGASLKIFQEKSSSFATNQGGMMSDEKFTASSLIAHQYITHDT